jgi:hypothetical protein
LVYLSIRGEVITSCVLAESVKVVVKSFTVSEGREAISDFLIVSIFLLQDKNSMQRAGKIKSKQTFCDIFILEFKP